MPASSKSRGYALTWPLNGSGRSGCPVRVITSSPRFNNCLVTYLPVYEKAPVTSIFIWCSFISQCIRFMSQLFQYTQNLGYVCQAEAFQPGNSFGKAVYRIEKVL